MKMKNAFAYRVMVDDSETIEEPIFRNSRTIMSKKVAVVTGSNKGIGFAIVKALCLQFDGDVILTARNIDRGIAAVKKLEEEGLYPKFHLLDITQIKSIKQFATYLKNHYGGLDILINNAAVGYQPWHPMPFREQAVNTINTNFFGTLNVCMELFPLLRAHARVVNLSSSAGRIICLPNKDLQDKFLKTSTKRDLCNLVNQFLEDVKAGVHDKKGWGSCSYKISKVAITALTFIQHQQFLKHPRKDIVVNAVHPGRVCTDLVNHDGPLSPEQGAEIPVYCALLPPFVSTPRGELVWCDKTIKNWLL